MKRVGAFSLASFVSMMFLTRASFANEELIAATRTTPARQAEQAWCDVERFSGDVL